MRPIRNIFIIGLSLLMLAGCGTTRPSAFYLLTPVEADGSGKPGEQSPVVGIGPVSFPAYLDRPEIVTRIGGNQLQYADFHRWAEPLKTAFSRALSENLSIMLPTDQTVIFPWSRSTVVDYQVKIDVLRFEAGADGTVVLSAGWELRHSSDGSVVKRDRSTYTEAAGSYDYSAIVVAQSRALERLSRDIARAIREQETDSG